MEKEEYIAYLNLRAEECGYQEDILGRVKKALDEGDLQLYDRLHRISEPDFRTWCISLADQTNDQT